MKTQFTRRQVLANSAAATAVLSLGSGVTTAFAKAAGLPAKSVGTHECAQLHAQIAEELNHFSNDVAANRSAMSHMLKTSHCPSCNTQIGLSA